MRIIAGSLGARAFQSPKGSRTHPMSDKVRGAIFNMLGDVTGLHVLDAFAGSGALCYEAVSRGAATAIGVDSDSNATLTMKRNIAGLALKNRVKAIRANVSSWSDNNPDQTFDIVLCDPPYDQLQLATIQKLIRHIAANGVLVISWPGSQPLPQFEGLWLVADKNYGDSQVGMYKY